MPPRFSKHRPNCEFSHNICVYLIGPHPLGTYAELLLARPDSKMCNSMPNSVIWRDFGKRTFRASVWRMLKAGHRGILTGQTVLPLP